MKLGRGGQCAGVDKAAFKKRSLHSTIGLGDLDMDEDVHALLHVATFKITGASLLVVQFFASICETFTISLFKVSNIC